MSKKVIVFIIAMVMLFGACFTSFASENEAFPDIDTNNGAENDSPASINLELSAKSAVLMEAETGTILYSHNPNERLAPASVTKIMSLLLVAEAIRDGRAKLDDKISISAKASGMGGSQIFLKEGEIFTLEELLKSTVIASANDSIVALAEHLYGSEDLFVAEMNKRAKEMNMQSTSFENCTGLDDTTVDHKTTAKDIAIMSRELIKHDIILKYSSVWQDSIRNGEFTLTNTNRLVRYYDGCTGLKTGSTDKAGYCISATAKRNGMHLIAVVMGCQTRDARNEDARKMLDYGFSSFALYKDEPSTIDTAPIKYGRKNEVDIATHGFSTLIEKGRLNSIEKTYHLPEFITAPISKGDKVGEIIYHINGEEIGKCDAYVTEAVDRIGILEIIYRIICSIIVGKS